MDTTRKDASAAITAMRPPRRPPPTRACYVGVDH
jgi:hypothetical protein